MVDVANNIKFCEIKKVFSDPGYNIGLCYEAVDLVDYRFMFIEHRYCRDTEKEAKELKKAKKS